MRKVLPSLLAFIIGCAIWEVVRVTASLPPIILPSLGSVFITVFTIHDLWYHAVLTSAEAAAGFLLGNFIAVALAIAIVRWRSLESAIVPYAVALKTTPVVAIAPILILWLGPGFASKVVAAATVCFFPTLINGVRGLRAIDQDYLDLFDSWKAGWWQSLLYLRLPSSLPYFFAAIKLSTSLALVGALIAEFVAADAGLGFLIVVFSRRLDTPELFATIAVCTALGVLWFLIIVLIERMLTKRFSLLSKAGELF